MGYGTEPVLPFGREFITYTDQQLLLAFYNQTKGVTPRIEKHILNIQDLKFRMVHMSGKENPVDWNSRHSEKIQNWSESLLENHFVDDGDELKLNRVTANHNLEVFDGKWHYQDQNGH